MILTVVLARATMIEVESMIIYFTKFWDYQAVNLPRNLELCAFRYRGLLLKNLYHRPQLHYLPSI